MIPSEKIKNAIYDLCVQANTTLPDSIFARILAAYNLEQNPDAKQALGLILTNAKMAYDKKMPLCQDTGQVLVFVKLGSSCHVEHLNESINQGVALAYDKNFYRKSVVKDAVFERVNTKTNTPCIIYTEIVDGDTLEIELLIKGGGSENMSKVSTLSPTASQTEIIDFVTSAVKKAGAKACPPYFIGIGIGGTTEYAGILSKKALLLEQNVDDEHKILAQKIKNTLNGLKIGAAGYGGASTVLDVKILTDFTHIACMPICVNINCHSSRHAKCIISEAKTVYFEQKQVKDYISKAIDENCLETAGQASNYVKVHTSDIEKLMLLRKGQKVLLSGDIYTARDMAHKRLVEMIEKGEKLPFDLREKIIFYAGPCPACDGCVVGSIGPTTSSRMDKYAPILYAKGLLATIGKGDRSIEVEAAIKHAGGVYFTIIGGIACYLSQKFVKKELVAFADLGTEAIYKFSVEGLPLRVDIS